MHSWPGDATALRKIWVKDEEQPSVPLQTAHTSVGRRTNPDPHPVLEKTGHSTLKTRKLHSVNFKVISDAKTSTDLL